MNLNEMRDNAKQNHWILGKAHEAEIARRKALAFEKLAALGITTKDGWILTPESADKHGIRITHPDLPTAALALISGDGCDTLFIHARPFFCEPDSGWHIARLMGAGL